MHPKPLLIWTMLFLVALDLTSRSIATQLPSPRVFSSYNIQRQAERLQNAEGECTDVVLLGTSLMGAAARPAEIAEELEPGVRITNAAVGGGGLLLLEPWINDLVVSSTCPSLAIVGLGPRDANDSFAGPEGTLSGYLSSKGRRRIIGDLDLPGRIDEIAERSLGLLQMRTAYREPANAAALAINGSGDWRPATDGSGQITFFESASYARDAEREAALQAGAFNEFVVGGRNTDALDAAIVALQDAGIDVIVVDMPRVDSAHERMIGRQALDDYEDAIAGVAERRGVRLLQADEVLDLSNDDVFADEYHLNRVGSRVFSQWLGASIVDG